MLVVKGNQIIRCKNVMIVDCVLFSSKVMLFIVPLKKEYVDAIYVIL